VPGGKRPTADLHSLDSSFLIAVIEGFGLAQRHSQMDEHKFPIGRCTNPNWTVLFP